MKLQNLLLAITLLCASALPAIAADVNWECKGNNDPKNYPGIYFTVGDGLFSGKVLTGRVEMQGDNPDVILANQTAIENGMKELNNGKEFYLYPKFKLGVPMGAHTRYRFSNSILDGNATQATLVIEYGAFTPYEPLFSFTCKPMPEGQEIPEHQLTL